MGHYIATTSRYIATEINLCLALALLFRACRRGDHIALKLGLITALEALIGVSLILHPLSEIPIKVQMESMTSNVIGIAFAYAICASQHEGSFHRTAEGREFILFACLAGMIIIFACGVSPYVNHQSTLEFADTVGSFMTTAVMILATSHVPGRLMKLAAVALSAMGVIELLYYLFELAPMPLAFKNAYVCFDNATQIASIIFLGAWVLTRPAKGFTPRMGGL